MRHRNRRTVKRPIDTTIDILRPYYTVTSLVNRIAHRKQPRHQTIPLDLCEACRLRPKYVEGGFQHPYCSRSCARYGKGHSTTACALPGCRSAGRGAFSNFCSDAHARKGVRFKQCNLQPPNHSPGTSGSTLTTKESPIQYRVGERHSAVYDFLEHPPSQGHDVQRVDTSPDPSRFSIYSSQQASPETLITPPTTASDSPRRYSRQSPTRPRVLFYHKHDPHYGFTNFSPHPVIYKGKRYPTSEHLFQSFKFQKHRPNLAEHIRTCSEMPSVAFAEARRFQPEVRPDWKHVNIEKMDKTLYHKFTQHLDLQAELLATGDAELVEDSDKDAFWGVGPDGRGHNELGKGLERLRTQLREAAQ